MTFRFGRGRKSWNCVLLICLRKTWILQIDYFRRIHRIVVVNVQLVSISPINGLVIGLIMSLPSTIVTRAYLPVILVGSLGSALIGFVRTWVGL